MLRSIALGTLFAFFLVRTPAATINVSVTCNNSTSTANGTTSANASCDSGDGASASASATTFSVYVTKATKRPLPDNFAAAQAATSTEVQIAITGGTGSGWYVPCLSVFFRFIGEGSANFGPVDFGPQTPGGGDSCSYARGNLDLTNPIINSLLIPFVFDTPQIQEVSLSAQTGGILTMGLAFASFNGNILVFDSKGQPVPTANFHGNRDTRTNAADAVSGSFACHRSLQTPAGEFLPKVLGKHINILAPQPSSLCRDRISLPIPQYSITSSRLTAREARSCAVWIRCFSPARKSA